MSLHETMMQYYITNSHLKLNLMSRGRGRGRGRGAAGLDAALPEDVKASSRGSWTIWKMAP